MSTRPITSRRSKSDETADTEEFRYVGFWARTSASLIDTLLFLATSLPLLVAVFGWDCFDEESSERSCSAAGQFLLNLVLPAVVTIGFWLTKQATPGKMAVSARIVDAKTGEAISAGQSLVRYIGYFLSMLPLCLGFFWVAFDKRKQGWHDKLAGTVVIRRRS